jgi:hypothetical protein
MEKVSIRFEKGVLQVLDEGGCTVETTRVTVYLVHGNSFPVALLEARGGKHEVEVSSLDVTGAAPVLATHEIVTEGMPRRKK